MRRAPSSAVGTGFQTDLAGNDLSLDNVDPKRRRLVTGRYELDFVRTCRQRQRLEAAAERARETYVAAIDEDEGLGWDDCETDSSLPRFKWTGGCVARSSIRRVRVTVVRIQLVLDVWVVRIWVVRIAPIPRERVVIEHSTTEMSAMVEVTIVVTMVEVTAVVAMIEMTIVAAMIKMLTTLVVITAASVAVHCVGIGMRACVSRRARWRCSLRVSAARRLSTACRASASCRLGAAARRASPSGRLSTAHRASNARRVSTTHRVSTAHTAAYVSDGAAARAPATTAALREDG